MGTSRERRQLDQRFSIQPFEHFPARLRRFAVLMHHMLWAVRPVFQNGQINLALILGQDDVVKLRESLGESPRLRSLLAEMLDSRAP